MIIVVPINVNRPPQLKEQLHHRTTMETLPPTQAKQNYARGRVIQVTIEEAHNTPTMMSDTTLVNLIV
jgi:hypothetical protein